MVGAWRRPLLMLAISVTTLGVVFAGAYALGDSGVLALVPFAGLLLPLVLGRYFGETRLAKLRGAPRLRAPRGLRLPAAPPRRSPLRSDRVLARGLARRPPPGPAPALTIL